MNDLEQLLQDVKLREELKTVLNRAVEQNEVNDCFWAVKNIESQMNNLSTNAKQIFNAEIKDLYLRVKWSAVPRLKDKEILDLLDHNVLATKEFELDLFNLTQQIRAYLLTIISYEERDRFKLKVRQALLNNKEVLSSSEVAGIKKTMGDWLRLIISQVGPLLDNRLKEGEFYLRDPNFTKLSLAEKGFIKEIIKLYQYCLFSSQSPAGLDEPIDVFEDGKMKVIQNGQIFSVPPLDTETAKIVDEFTYGFSAGSNERNVATEVINQLQARYQQILGQLLPNGAAAVKGESHIPEVILDQLNNNLALKDTAAVIGNLENLIILKALAQLVRSRNFIADFGIFVEAHVGQGFKDELNRLTPEVLGLFLQYLLSGKLKLSGEQSAVVGLHLARALGQSGQQNFMPIAYGDLKTGAFKWREVTGENGKLRFK